MMFLRVAVTGHSFILMVFVSRCSVRTPRVLVVGLLTALYTCPSAYAVDLYLYVDLICNLSGIKSCILRRAWVRISRGSCGFTRVSFLRIPYMTSLFELAAYRNLSIPVQPTA